MTSSTEQVFTTLEPVLAGNRISKQFVNSMISCANKFSGMESMAKG
jgi:hypothetical protein